MKIESIEATGTLAQLLGEMDKRELARMRKRMMVAAKIEESMKKCGLNQTQFARLMGKSPTVVSEWLSGDRNFTIDTLTDIEEILQIQLLNVSMMTVVSSGTASICKLSSHPTKTVVLTNAVWKTGKNSIEYIPQTNIA